jgi:hypothetical protein
LIVRSEFAEVFGDVLVDVSGPELLVLRCRHLRSGVLADLFVC